MKWNEAALLRWQGPKISESKPQSPIASFDIRKTVNLALTKKLLSKLLRCFGGTYLEPPVRRCSCGKLR